MTRPKRPEERANRLGHDPATGRFTPDHPYPAGPGAVTGLDDELIAALAAETRKDSFRGACNRLGVLLRTAQGWRTRGERERAIGVDSPYARFSAAIDRARGEQELELVEGAKTGALPERVAMFLLERVHQQTYQQKQTLEIEGHVEHTDVRARLEARLIRTLEATPDSGEPALDEPSRAGHPLALPEPGGT